MNKLLFWNLLLGIALLVTACYAPNEQRPVPTANLTIPSTTAVSVPEPTMPAPAPTPTPVNDEAIIAYEMQAAFRFFWEQANTNPDSPGYGLIRDRYPGSAGIASIAAVGFGLSAIIVGVERGYISYDQGYERVLGTLQTLTRMEREQGFFYHFVDMESGKRAWQSEVSSIDTAILMMGVLSVGQYFGHDVQQLADELYAGVNWGWFLDPDRQMFYMAYRPEEGFSGHWDF